MVLAVVQDKLLDTDVSITFCEPSCNAATQATFEPFRRPLLQSSLAVDRNDALRAKVARWVDLGFDQKKFAAAMGRSESWFSRWLNQKGDVERSPTLIEADKLERFLAGMRTALLVEPANIDQLNEVPQARSSEDAATAAIVRLANDEKTKLVGSRPTSRTKNRRAKQKVK